MENLIFFDVKKNQKTYTLFKIFENFARCCAEISEDFGEVSSFAEIC